MLLLVTNYAADWDEELDLKQKIILMQQLSEKQFKHQLNATSQVMFTMKLCELDKTRFRD